MEATSSRSNFAVLSYSHTDTISDIDKAQHVDSPITILMIKSCLTSQIEYYGHLAQDAQHVDLRYVTVFENE